MRFSIVIPAYNEAEILPKTLLSLRRLGTPKKDYEVIVVDNNSKDATSEVSKKLGARAIFEATPGTNFAREAGRKAAQGEIIVFLDSDCEPPIDWLSRIEADLSLPGVAAVSGPYDYGFRGFLGFVGNFYERFILVIAPKLLRILFWKKAGVLIGGNFAGRRETFEKIGGLPPLKFYGDDAAIAMLVARRAGKVLFDPDLKVKSSPRRFETQGLFKTNLKYISTYLKIYFDKKFR